MKKDLMKTNVYDTQKNDIKIAEIVKNTKRNWK